MTKERPSTTASKGPLLAIALSALAIACIVGAGQSVIAFESFYASRFAPGVAIGSTDVSHRTKDDVRTLLSAYASSLTEEGVRVRLGDKTEMILAHSIPLTADAPQTEASSPISIDIEQTIQKAFAIGHRDTFFASTIERIAGLTKTRTVAPETAIDRERFTREMEEKFKPLLIQAQEPHFILAENGLLGIAPGTAGRSYDGDALLAGISRAVTRLERPSVSASLKTVAPRLSENALRAHVSRAETVLEQSPRALRADTHSFSLSRATKASWLTLSGDTSDVIFDPSAIREYLLTVVEPEVRVMPQAPHFAIDSGRLRALSIPVTGKELDIDKSVAAFIAAPSTDPLLLVIRSIASPLSENAGDIRVPEMIADAETDFKGSPTNRKKNIAIGMQRINGLLVLPDEEFSLIKALGPIEISNGFLPELVIKGNKTTPEAGGGLCQVSTTLFRAVAQAGLPVLERKNHSYRVSYYEPPVGFDATVYFPKPDFRFKNDTGNPVLVVASIQGTKARITLWGTKDGRTVEVDAPTVTNITKPGTTKIIETEDLPPGKKKCTERAHNGADAIFERRVAYPNGEVKTDTFKSHYVVWPAVCLVGRKIDDQSEGAASSTPATGGKEETSTAANE